MACGIVDDLPQRHLVSVRRYKHATMHKLETPHANAALHKGERQHRARPISGGRASPLETMYSHSLLSSSGVAGAQTPLLTGSEQSRSEASVQDTVALFLWGLSRPPSSALHTLHAKYPRAPPHRTHSLEQPQFQPRPLIMQAPAGRAPASLSIPPTSQPACSNTKLLASHISHTSPAFDPLQACAG